MDILAIGEILIDLTQTGTGENGIPQFAANPGGAPANLAVAAARLGAQTAFIGKVGADGFGSYLTSVLKQNGVDASHVAVDPEDPTTIAVVSVDASGERSFSFYRKANADVKLTAGDIPDSALQRARFVHFGSVSLTADPSRSATLDAVRRARAMGKVITYDPNYRANLWPDAAAAVAQMKAPLKLVDILKVSDEELPLLTGTTDYEAGTALLAEQGIRLVFVTLGPDGVFYRMGGQTGRVAGVPCTVGDTNGAGDTFFGAALSKLCKEDLDALTPEKLEAILAFANKAASLTTSRHGAIPAMPTLAEVEGLKFRHITCPQESHTDLPAGSLYFPGFECTPYSLIRKQGLGKALPNKYDRNVQPQFQILKLWPQVDTCLSLFPSKMKIQISN